MEVLPDAGVGGDASRHREPFVPQFLHRLHRAGHQAVADRFGKRGCQRGPVQFLPRLLGMVGQVDYRGLQPGKAHVIGSPLHMGDRESVLCVVSAPGEVVDGFASGIGQAEDARGLVKALPCRVVPGCAEDMHVRIVPHVDDQGVSARDREADKGRFQFREGQIVCRDMPADVVHRNQGYLQYGGDRLGKVHPHQHRADKPRRIGDGNRVDVRAGQARCLQRPLGQERNRFHMAAGRNLGDNAAVDRVELRLGKNLVR